MSEAMTLDCGKPSSSALSTTDDQQPLFARQTQLATLMQNMVEKSTTQEAAAIKVSAYVNYVRAAWFISRHLLIT